MEEYTINPEFREYVDRYCNKHDVTPEQAVEHKLIQYVLEEYRHKRINCRR